VHFSVNSDTPYLSPVLPGNLLVLNQRFLRISRKNPFFCGDINLMFYMAE